MVVLSIVDDTAGRVSVDFTVANLATTVVEGDGISVDSTVTVSTLVEVTVDPATVIFTVFVGDNVLDVEGCPCAEDEAMVIVT